MPRIEICGGIASGKTTLASLSAATGLFEDFSSNPFLRAFYDDPRRYAFETEISFLLQHYHQIKTAWPETLLICDFSFVLDLAYARVTLKPQQLAAFEAVLEQVVADVGRPDVLVHVTCGANEERERIRRRGRDYEQAVSLDYLERINLEVTREVAGLEGERPLVVCIDSERVNFATDERARQDIASTLARVL